MKTRGRLAAWEGQGGLCSTLPPPLRRAATLAGLGLGAWFSPQPEGWVGRARGRGTAAGALEPAVATALLCAPPAPQACLLRPQSAIWLGGGRGEKTQIRHRPGSSEPGCGLVQGVRRRELKPDGCLWPAPSREAARPCSTMGPLLRLALHLPLTLPGDLGLAPSQGINLAQDGGRWAGSPCEPRPMLSVRHTPAQSHMVGCNS